MAEEGHFGSNKLDKLHKRLEGTESGACLTGHEASFKNRSGKFTCNYRYQAYEHADNNGAIKSRLHDYSTRKRKKIATSAPEGGDHGRYPSHYSTLIRPPRKGDWDIGGPVTSITRRSIAGERVTIKATMNFTQDTWPYWNNAHHLIPKGTLKARVLEEESRVSDLIQQCLLKAKYNINHKKNMLLLPQDREVARILNLPRHLQLQHADGSVRIEVANHPVYNLMALQIEGGLNTIIKSYAATCKDALTKAKKKKHRVPKASLDKAKLEKLSKTLLDMILNWSGPQSLDAKAKALLDKM
jgi:hypothetical protein